MKSATSTCDRSKSTFFVALIKGSLIALSVSLVGICIFAFLLRFIDIDTGMIRPINQGIKIVSVFVGVFCGLKNVKEMGLVTGFLIGCLYTFLAFFVFSLLNGGVSFSPSLINDLLFGGIAGGICGVMCVNLLKKSK